MDLAEKWTKFFTVLLVSVFAYTTFMFTATSFTFFQRPERNTSTFLSRCMVYNFMVKIFRFQLRHHVCLIEPTLLQLHHRISLTTLTLSTRAPLAIITRDPLTLITLPYPRSLHYVILSHYAVFINLHIPQVSQLIYLPPTFPPLTHKSDSSLITKYIWNTSTLLLLFNDVEINPGPQPNDQNPVFCCIYSNKINRGVQQEMAPTCFAENCNSRCHQACNGLSIHQTRHAKNSGRSITWKCLQHGSGIAEIIAPPPPVYEIPSRPSAICKSCSVCKNPIRTRYADLAYHCANPSCDNVSSCSHVQWLC